MPDPDPTRQPTAEFAQPDVGGATASFPGDPAATRDLLPPAAAAAPPAAVPGYVIELELGRGGMGVVYLARQEKLNRPVALKMILAGGHASDAQRARFLAEAEAVAAVQHPGIVQVYEFGAQDGQPYFALEYCPGGSLADTLAGTPLPPAEAAALVGKVARAVQAAHAAGVVHRDLKPGNVLLGADGSPKVTDFGLARRADTASGVTATGAILGSPSYMAPEQAAGHGKAVGPAADVYALGAILYECLTGRPPFRAATPVDTIMQVVRDEPVPPSRLVPKLPRDLETVCLKCLRKDPAHRYPSAAALADDLGRFLDGRPVVARPVPAWERAWRAAKRRPAVAFSLAAVALSLVTVTTVVLVANRRLAVERNAANEQRDKADAARRDADVERARAQARLDTALDAIDRMMVRVAGEKWARNPSLQAERREVLEEAVAAYQGFSAEDSKVPEVRRRAALANHRAAVAYMALGDYPKAEATVGRARALQEGLVVEFPDDPDRAAELAETVAASGHLAMLTARLGDGKQAYELAVRLARKAVAARPDREEYRTALVEYLSFVGHFDSYLGPEASLIYFTEATALARGLCAGPNPSFPARLFLAISLLNISPMEAARRRPMEAETTLAEAEQLLAGLAGGRPPSARLADLYDTARAQAQTERGQRLAAAGKPEQGLAKVEEALAIVDGLLAAQPKTISLLIQKLNGLAAKAEILTRLGRRAEARKAVSELVSLSEGAVRATPQMAWLRQRYVVQQSVRLVQHVRDEGPEGLDERTADLLRPLPHARDPSHGPGVELVRYNVACAYAQAAGKAGRPEDHETWAAKAVEMLERLRRDGFFASPGSVKLLDNDADFGPIHGRDDFKQFRAQLKPPPPPGK
jgi:serine/threonine-protein kinase